MKNTKPTTTPSGGHCDHGYGQTYDGFWTDGPCPECEGADEDCGDEIPKERC